MVKFGVVLEEDRAPLQTVRELFLFRNWLVHTRPEIIEEDYTEIYSENVEQSIAQMGKVPLSSNKRPRVERYGSDDQSA